MDYTREDIHRLTITQRNEVDCTGQKNRRLPEKVILWRNSEAPCLGSKIVVDVDSKRLVRLCQVSTAKDVLRCFAGDKTICENRRARVQVG